MKRIAFILPQYLPVSLPGSGTFIVTLAERLTRDGNDVTVITSDAFFARSWYAPIFGKAIEVKKEDIHGVHVIRLPSNWILSSVYFVLSRIAKKLHVKKIEEMPSFKSMGPILIGLREELEKGRFDIIHCSPFPLYINYQVYEVIRNFSKKPRFILTPFFHGGIREFHNSYLAQVARGSDRIHVISDCEKQDMKRLSGTEGKNIVTIPLSIDIKTYSSRKAVEERKKEINRRYGVGDKTIILFAGNKGYFKGTIDLLRVCSALYKKNRKILLVTIGNAMPEWTNEMKKEKYPYLLDLPYQHGVDKEAWFSLARVFAMPSIGESFGLVYLEAWHQKKPVVGADISAVAELIGKNKGGLLVPFHDQSELKKAIKQLITHGKLASRLGYNGFEALMSKYTFEENFKQYKKLFK